MTDNQTSNQHAASLLRECYETALRLNRDDAAREILQARLQAAVVVGASFHPEPKEPVQQGSALSAPGEEAYFRALQALERGTTETFRTEALRHIREALAALPDDPRYLALADILQEACE